MIPLKALFEAASQSPAVKRGAILVVMTSLALYGAKLVFGSDVQVTTTNAAACEVKLADQSARLDLTTQARDACARALDLCTGTSP